MAFEQLLNWLLVPALGGLGWVARSVSRLESEVVQLKESDIDMWKRINQHSEDISDVKQSVARIEGRLQKS